MNNELYYHDIFPKLLRVGQQTTIRVTNRDGSELYNFNQDEKYTVTMLPMDEGVWKWDEPRTSMEYSINNGALEFSYTPKKEMEYRIGIRKEGSQEPIWGGMQFRVFALNDDLFSRRPLKGDLHVHSTGSDGCERPELVCASYRRAGFDFFSLTDHRNYAPSVRVCDSYAGVKLGMTLLHGEECHCPKNEVHVVNFGGTESVVKKYDSYGDSFPAVIEEFAKTLSVPEGIDPYQYAATIWEFREIRKVGGLAIFPHPYWEAYIYNVNTELSKALFASREFDAFEIYGGQSVHENNMQTLLYTEMCAQGLGCPVVGSSDSHGSIRKTNFTEMYTIVFAKSRSREDILQAVRDGYCVAVEHRHGEFPRVTGSLRLGAIAMYLLEQYFPFHDDICHGEGVLMREYAEALQNENAAAAAKTKAILDASATRSADFTEKLYNI